jgi:hypothetical protein
MMKNSKNSVRWPGSWPTRDNRLNLSYVASHKESVTPDYFNVRVSKGNLKNTRKVLNIDALQNI